MALNFDVMRAIEKLGYRVTVGDVASQAGLDVKLAERDILALASEAGGHLQVAESGEIAYVFPRNFRNILRSKSWRLRWQERLKQLWSVLFYLIRISFGILLIVSIVLIFITIAIILIAISSTRGDGDNGGDSGNGGMVFMPSFWISPDWFLIFSPDYYSQPDSRRRKKKYRATDADRPMNFLEAVFSFLFGDGDPNADLEERRWRSIATVIRNNRGAVAAEQIAPYLNDLGEGYGREYEDYMLPVLTRFNGRPEVSPEGQIVYYFPELQVTANEHRTQSVAAYLKELPWRFSRAGTGQIIFAAGLGAVNLVGALVLGSLLRDGAIAAELGTLVGFVAGIYGVLLAYGIGFLAIPLIRYFWIQRRNKTVEARNQQRQERAIALNEAGTDIQKKIGFARQFAATTVVSEADLAYTTEQSLTEQELLNADKIDAEWQRRLESGEL